MASTHVETSKAIHRRTGRTFYVATRLLPERVREATYVLYAFFRIADDVVDQADPPPVEVRRRKLAAIRRAAKGGAVDEKLLSAEERAVLSGFRTLAAREGIDSSEIDVFIDAMARDVDQDRYESYAELSEYMRGSAAAVGNMMLTVMEPAARDRAESHARSMAEAFQLTNFLRDVREDIRQYDRVYLPRETLDRYGVTEADLRRDAASDGVAAAVRTALERTESLYRHGIAGVRYLPQDCQFAVLLAAVLYAEHHRLIRELDYDVLGGDASLSVPRRLWLVAKTYYHWRGTQDPEATFYAASAVPEGTTAPQRGKAFGAVPESVG